MVVWFFSPRVSENRLSNPPSITAAFTLRAQVLFTSSAAEYAAARVNENTESAANRKTNAATDSTILFALPLRHDLYLMLYFMPRIN